MYMHGPRYIQHVHDSFCGCGQSVLGWAGLGWDALPTSFETFSSTVLGEPICHSVAGKAALEVQITGRVHSTVHGMAVRW